MNAESLHVILILAVLSPRCTVFGISFDDEENIFNLTVVVNVRPNARTFEMINSKQSPSINCYLLKSNHLEDLSLYWEFCSDNSKQNGSSNSMLTRHNHITLQLKRFPDPGDYCYRCIINKTDGTRIYRSKEILVTIEDNICGTPPRNQISAEVNKFLCSLIKSPSTKCQRHTVEALKIIDRVNEIGETEVILLWRKPKQHTDTVYGYKFEVKNLDRRSHDDTVFKVCLITKYGPFTKKLNISEDKHYTYYSTFLDYISTESEIEVIETRTQNTSFSVWSLPLSSELTTTVVLKSRKELCEEFVRNNNGKIPDQCFPFESITVNDGCLDNGKLRKNSIKLSWMTRSGWVSKHSGLNKTHIKIRIPSLFLHIYKSVKDTSITIPVDYPSNFDMDGEILFVRICTGCNEEHLSSTYVRLPNCKQARTGLTDIKQNVPVVIAITIIVSTLVIVGIVLRWYKNVRKDISRIIFRSKTKNNNKTDFQSDLVKCNMVEKEEAAVEIVDNIPTVMLVHPHGCVEVENLVVFLVSQLNTFGVKVLSDIVQSELVAKESLSRVLVDNFNDADYVVVICAENKGNELPCHKPYDFVLNQLISNACVFQSNNTKNYNRFLAVYFSSNESVPSYLIARAYQLPMEFAALVQNIFGVKTHFSYLYNKIFEHNVPRYMERKQHLQQLTRSLRKKEHRNCYISTCKKGKLSESLELEGLPPTPISYVDEENDSLDDWNSSEENDDSEDCIQNKRKDVLLNKALKKRVQFECENSKPKEESMKFMTETAA